MTQYYCEKHDNYHVTETSGCEDCQAEWELEKEEKDAGIHSGKVHSEK